MKIALIGGHLTPALSLIEVIPSTDTIIYIGRKYALEGDEALSLEYKIIKEKNIEFIPIKAGRIQRSLTKQSVPAALKIPAGFYNAFKVLVRNRPDVVVGFGGYLSVPIGFAAKALRIPVVIHEQTQEAGLSNKMLSKVANKICISFESSRKYFPKQKTVLTGNPIRSAIKNPVKVFKKPQDLPMIFITGGSLGSHAINTLVENSLNSLLDKYIVIHQTGAAEEFKDFDRLSEYREKLSGEKKERYIISKFFKPDEIGGIFKKADLVVCRAGINTVSELIVLRKPSFLIPLPISQRNEQFKNAFLLKKIQLGEIGEQKSLTPEEFTRTIHLMMDNIENYHPKKLSITFPKDAASKILEVTYATSKKSH